MKAYNEYMDQITVSDALHRKFVSCTKNAKPDHYTLVIRQYTTVFACLAVILLGAVMVPRLLQSNLSLPPGSTPSVSQPGGPISSPGSANTFVLTFNQASGQLATNKTDISGHFWQELTSDELQNIFPDLTEKYAVTATANFRGDGTLVNIDAHAVSVSSCQAYIQVAPGQVELDYLLDGKVMISDVRGTAVTAGYFETKPNSKGQRNIIYFASFKLSDLAYYVELGGAEAEKEELKREISALIGLLVKGGAADLNALANPTIPELREDTLDLNEARADVDFGTYLPVTLPDGFAFESAMRLINQESNYLSVLWIKGMGNIHWRVSALEEDDKARLTSVADTQNYDLALYPAPRAASVPDELREIVDNPVFRIEDLTLTVVQARAYEVADMGDISGPRMRFGVLYGDVLVEINLKGVTPVEVFQLLQQIR